MDSSEYARDRDDEGGDRRELRPQKQLGMGAGVEIRTKPEFRAEKERGGIHRHGSREGHGHPHDQELSVYETGEKKSELFNNAQGSHSDFQASVTQQTKKINTLQDVYEDWKHPAFRSADFYKRVFEKGLKVHGEAASIEYWKSKREPYRQVFEQKIEQVEKELGSPLLSYMSDEARVLALQKIK